jgi:hypothetical protein
MILNQNCGVKLWNLSTIPLLISFVALVGTVLPFPFWKGVLWAARAAKMGYKWKIGDGKNIRFWEDQWFGSCSLAIQYWDLYSISNEKNISVKDAWDGRNLRLTFRRTVSQTLMNQWYELLDICSSISYSSEKDAIIWHFHSTGKYSVQSLYAVVSDRGVRHIFTPVVWKISVPSRLHVFLWLLSNNKVLTHDSLAKRRHVEDMSCLFCSEPETVSHLFFLNVALLGLFGRMCRRSRVWMLAVTLSQLLNVA